LLDLRRQGKIDAKSRWQEFYPLIKDDDRYLEMLGQPGSTPIELFWDIVEDVYEELYAKRKHIEKIMKASSWLDDIVLY
jgi:pre-mRNA-processing factor 40